MRAVCAKLGLETGGRRGTGDDAVLVKVERARERFNNNDAGEAMEERGAR